MRAQKKPRIYLRGPVWWAYYRAKRWSLGTADRAEAERVASMFLEREPGHIAREIVARLKSDDFLREYVRRAVWGNDADAVKVGWVYFMEAAGLVKIGYTREIQQRLEHVQSHNAAEVRLVRKERGNRTLERSHHKRWRELRVRGEWYRLEGDLADYISGARSSETASVEAV